MPVTFGAETEFLSAYHVDYVSAAWLGADKFVVAYMDAADSNRGKARVGTVSGADIAFGAEAEFLSADGAHDISAAALGADKFVVAYRDYADSYHGTARVGTVSGTDITFGAEAEFLPGEAGAFISAAAWAGADKFVVAYQNIDSLGHGAARVGTVSGADIAFGAEAEFASAGYAGWISAAALGAGKFVVAYMDGADGQHGTARVGTVSGADITFGAEAEFASAGGTDYVSAAALGAGKFVVAYRDYADSYHGTARVGTVSGTTIAFGAEAEFLSENWTDGAWNISAAALSATSFIVAYTDSADDEHGTAKLGAVGGTTIAFGAEMEFLSAEGAWGISAAALSGAIAGCAMGAAGMLGGANVIFYHPLDSFAEYTQGQVWTGSGAFVDGKVAKAVDGTASMTAHTQFVVAYQDGADDEHGTAKVGSAYPTAVGKTRVAAAMWAKGLGAGSSVATVERGYRIDMAAASVSLGGAAWGGAGIASLMASLNDGGVWFLALDFENTAGADWRLRTAIKAAGDPTPLAWVDQGAQDSGSQAVAAADTAPRLAVAAGGAGQWIDELVLWAGDKAAFAPFTAQELMNLQDLADTFGAPMGQYQEYFGAPICWQATARMPDGSLWRDSGCGPCPAVVRVPRGASDVVVTDDGRAASPRVVEG